MISIFVKLYVYNEARKKKIRISNIELQLIKELEQFSSWSGKIWYAWFWSAGVHIPNASATIPGLILINAEWAARIVLYQKNQNMHDAFKLTVCHEMTHQENDFSFFDFFTKDGIFVNWINEVHADFGGTEKAFNGERKKAIYGMKYKLSCKQKKDKDTRSHPSWNRRIEYISNYNFDYNLIDKIAFDVGCENSKLILAVKKHFSEIKLKN